MNKELLVKIWILLIILTLILSFIAMIYPFQRIFSLWNFQGPLFILNLIVVISGLIISIFLIRQKVKFSKYLLVLSAIILLIWFIVVFTVLSGSFG